MAVLVSSNNPQGRITNSELELAALVLQKATFPFVSTNLTWRAPFTGSDNIPTVNWTFWEASTVNPLVFYLIHLQYLINHQLKIILSVFYHPGTQNNMADDTSRKFHLVPDIFLSLFSTTYSPQQSPGMWHTCHPPSGIVSSVIPALRKQPLKVGVSPVKRLPRSIVTRSPSAPKCRCTTCLRTRRTLLSMSFKYFVTGSVTDTTPHIFSVSGRTRLLWRGALSPRLAYCKTSGTLRSRLGPTARNSTNTSPACAAAMVSRIHTHGVRSQSPWVL